MKDIHTLYLCYFGLREPLVQTQVLPYLREIQKLAELKVNLLTFEPDFKEKWTAEEIELEKQRLEKEGIYWSFLPYHKIPSVPATIYDVLNGVRFILKLSRKEKFDIFHARAHIPLLISLIARLFIKSKIIFDIRGLMAEEYVDAGVWRENSIPFRIIKRIERLGLKHADKVVVLTNRMREYLVENGFKNNEDIEVVPCCVDSSRIAVDDNSQKNKRFELIYAGSVTGLYLLREMGLFFLELKKLKSDAFFRILTVSPPDFVNKIFQEIGIKKNDFQVQKVPPSEVLNFMKKAHLAISFRKSTFSQIAASPTKVPEFLAVGLPIVSNSGIGDSDAIITKEKIGVILDDFRDKDYFEAVEKIESLINDKNLPELCKKIANQEFDLERIGGVRYRRLYQQLLQT